MSLLKDKIELAIEETELKAQTELSTFPTWSKWVIFLCLFSFLPAYFLTKKISQSYWDKKYSVLRVSAKPSFVNPKPIRIVSLELTTIGENNYSLLATLQNDNIELSAKEFFYEFIFFNEKNTPVAVLNAQTKGSSFILPNQKKHLNLGKIFSPEKLTKTQMIIDPKIFWQKKINIPQIKLTTFSPILTNQLQPLQFSVETSVRNDSSFLLKNVKIFLVVYDQYKQVIASSERNEYDLAPREKRTVKQIWPNVYSIQANSAEVFVETNTLDVNNLKTQNLTPSKASDLDRPENSNSQ